MAEEAAIDLTIKTGDAEKNTQSLKSRLKELKQELAGLDEGSAEFNKLALEAGKVQDKIGDINKRVNVLASDTRKLDTVVGVAQGIAGGFAAAQGAIALFGAENEDLNKTLVKVQGSVALLSGVQQIANTLQKESAVVTGISAAAQAVYAFVVGTSTGALKLFRIALASTGIGLVVIAIGALIANWETLTKWISASTDELDKHAAATKANTEAMKAQSKQLEQSAKDDLAVALEQWKSIKAIREQQGLDTIEADKKIHEIRLAQGVTEKELRIEQIKDQTNDTLELLKDRAAKEAEQEKARLQAIEDARKEKEAQIEEERIQALRDKYEYDQETLQTLKDAEAQALQDDLDLKKSYDEQDIERRKALNAQVADLRLSDLNNAKWTAEQQAIIQQAKNNLQQQGFSFARNLAGLAIKDARKQAIAMKAIAIVELAINTAKSISNAITGATSSATATGPGAVVATPIFIASQIATVLAAAAQAAAIIGAPLPRADASGSGTPPSNAPTDGNTQVPQIPQNPQSIPIPQQVYVTETDITGTQQQVNVIEGLSKIE